VPRRVKFWVERWDRGIEGNVVLGKHESVSVGERWCQWLMAGLVLREREKSPPCGWTFLVE